MNSTNDPGDDDLRRLLRAAGQTNERKAPVFQDTWRAAKTSRPTSRPLVRLAWAATAATVIALGIIAVRPRQAAPVAVDQIKSDEPLPTDFLLTNNRDDPVDRLAGEIDALLRP